MQLHPAFKKLDRHGRCPRSSRSLGRLSQSCQKARGDYEFAGRCCHRPGRTAYPYGSTIPFRDLRGKPQSARAPTLQFVFVRGLLRLRAKTPAEAPLFQLPPASGKRSRRLPFTAYCPLRLSCSCLIQPPIMRPSSSTSLLIACQRCASIFSGLSAAFPSLNRKYPNS